MMFGLLATMGYDPGPSLWSPGCAQDGAAYRSDPKKRWKLRRRGGK